MAQHFYTGRPVFATFLFDVSGSMKGSESAVVNGHKLMLEALRGSERCEEGVLYVYQALFADKPQMLQEFYPLHPEGKDQIVTLTTSNYCPSGMTSLYDTIITAIGEIEVNLNYARKRGLKGTATIAVITDGDDTCSVKSAKDVQDAIARLRASEQLISSVVLGLQSPQFTEQMLEQLRSEMGFGQAISLTKSPRDIRRAFILASNPRPDRN